MCWFVIKCIKILNPSTWSLQILGFFSNPFDVIKTRQQLQGEMIQMKGVKDLQVKKALRKQPYKNIFQSIKSIIHAEGFKGLQKVLPSALAFQFFMNSVRLGTYQTIDNLGWNRRKNGELHEGLCVVWGKLKHWEPENPGIVNMI